MNLSRTKNSQCRYRLCKTPDEVVMYFKDKAAAKYKKDGRIYIQIDGEFISVRYMKQVNLRWLKTVYVLQNASK